MVGKFAIAPCPPISAAAGEFAHPTTGGGKSLRRARRFMRRGVRAAFSVPPCNAVATPTCGRAGFSLLEALVALALVLTFAAVLGPTLFHARRIMQHSGSRIAAHVVLRTLLDAPFDRSKLENVAREGDIAGLHWRIVSQPIGSFVPADSESQDAEPRRSKWSAFRVIASVAWGDGQIVTAETMRLGTTQ